MKNIADRINELINSQGLSKNEFAKGIGISSSLISQITTKKNNFRADILQKITSKYPNLNSAWLLNGIGEMWLKTQIQNPHLTEKKHRFDDLPAYKQEEMKKAMAIAGQISQQIEDIQKEQNELIANTQGIDFVYIGKVHELIKRDTPALMELKADIDFVRQFQDVINDIEDQYIETLRNALWRFRGDKFSLKQYQANVTEELEKLMPYKPAFETLAKHINDFYIQMRELGAEKVEFDDYIKENIDELK